MTRALPILLLALAACSTDADGGPDAGSRDAGDTTTDAGDTTTDAGDSDAGADAGTPEPGANLSFEFPAIASGGEVVSDPIAWTVDRSNAGTAGLTRPPTTADGEQVAFVRVSADEDEVSLTSSPVATVEASKRYVVRIATGAPATGPRASLGLALAVGSVDADGVTSTSVMGDLLDRGAFDDQTLTWTAPSEGLLVGEPLRVRVRASGLGGTGSAYVDDVRLGE